MRKHMNFAEFYGDGWPDPKDLEKYFVATPGEAWFEKEGNDTAVLVYEGVDDTGHLPVGGGRVDIRLRMWGDRKLGVLLIYSKLGSVDGFAFTSKGDFERVGLYTRTLQGDPMPAWHYIPFVHAWKVVKEFLETDGTLPQSIEWISNKDLKPDTFPDPIPEHLGGPSLKYI